MKILKGVMLTVTLLATLVACGEKEIENNNLNNKKPQNENNIIENKNNNISSEKEEDIIEFSMGEWKENVYTNEFLDIKYKLPEDWNYSSDEEIASIMNLEADVTFKDKELLKEISERSSVYYVISSDKNGGSNLSILSEKPIVNITEEEYLKQLETQLEGLDSIKYEIGEKSSQTVGENSYETMEVNVPDYNMHQKYYIRKKDNYFIGIIITSLSTENIDEIIKNFE